MEMVSVCNKCRKALCSRYAGLGNDAAEEGAAGVGLNMDRELLGFLGLVAGECGTFDVLGLRKRLGGKVGEVLTQDTSEFLEDARMILGSYGLLNERGTPLIGPGDV